MKKVIATITALALLTVMIMMNVQSTSLSSKSDSQIALNSKTESTLLDDSELIFEGGKKWVCILLAALGLTASYAGMLLSTATMGATFWISFAGSRIAIASLIECFF